MSSGERLLSPSFLFRFSLPCQHCDETWPVERMELSEASQLPSFGPLDKKPLFADLRLGWNEHGMAVSVHVQGKRQTPWCREARSEESDGLQLFLDTRDTKNIHRGSRFCHFFVFLPQGSGRSGNDPFGGLLAIPRAQANPKSIPRDALQVRSEQRVDGYLLRAWIPASTITGYDTQDHRRLGFFYQVVDRELGLQTLNLGPEFPVTSDPSLWATLELC